MLRQRRDPRGKIRLRYIKAVHLKPMALPAFGQTGVLPAKAAGSISLPVAYR